MQSRLTRQKQLEQRESRQLDRSNNLLSDETSSAIEAIFSPLFSPPSSICDLWSLWLMFIVFKLYQNPKEMGMCPCSHYPGKQKEMTSSISCRQNHRFQLLIERAQRGGGCGLWKIPLQKQLCTRPWVNSCWLYLIAVKWRYTLSRMTRRARKSRRVGQRQPRGWNLGQRKAWRTGQPPHPPC